MTQINAAPDTSIIPSPADVTVSNHVIYIIDDRIMVAAAPNLVRSTPTSTTTFNQESMLSLS